MYIERNLKRMFSLFSKYTLINDEIKLATRQNRNDAHVHIAKTKRNRRSMVFMI